MILLKGNAVMTTNRKAHTIYIDDLLYNEITNVPELANYSFSKKVSFILQKYLDDQNNKENKSKIWYFLRSGPIFFKQLIGKIVHISAYQ